MVMEVLGIDVGGTGIKAAVVDADLGRLLSSRLRLPTPQPATPLDVTVMLAEMVRHFNWSGPVGCGFPAVVRDGEIRTAANIDDEWIGVNAQDAFREATGLACTVVNDADAAGLAEVMFGAGQTTDGVVLVLTLGTGIGSSLFVKGMLVPNTEFGQIEIEGRVAETWAAEIVRQQKRLSWKKWGRRLDRYLAAINLYTQPDLIILGGGGSRKFEKFKPYLTVKTDVVPASLQNEAGIVGAALAALPAN